MIQIDLMIHDDRSRFRMTDCHRDDFGFHGGRRRACGQGYHQPTVTQATNSATTAETQISRDDDPLDGAVGRPVAARARRGRPARAPTARRSRRASAGRAGHRRPGQGGIRLMTPSPRPGPAGARRTSRRVAAARPSISSRIAAAAVSAGTCFASDWCAPLDLDLPSLSPRSPTTTRSGMPIRSASLNLKPGRWSRSSTSTSSPAAVRAVSSAAACSITAAFWIWSGTSST